MNPAALHSIDITVAGLQASQSVNVHSDEFYVITCFAIRLGDAGTKFVTSGSTLPFADAARLEDKTWREQLAREHLNQLAKESRQLVAEIDKRLETIGEEHMRAVHADGSECADGCDAAPLPSWMETRHGAAE